MLNIFSIKVRKGMDPYDEYLVRQGLLSPSEARCRAQATPLNIRVDQLPVAPKMLHNMSHLMIAVDEISKAIGD
jgi:hypothetical protein